MQAISLSDYGNASTIPSPVAQMMSDFSDDFRPGIDINLGVGYVNEQTIPRQPIADALEYILAHPEQYPIPFNYGSPAGAENLRHAIRRFLIQQQIGHLTEADLADRRLLIGASGATSLLDAITSVLRPGVVICTDPIYYIYCHQLQRAGFELLAIPEDEQGLDLQQLKKKLNAPAFDLNRLSFIYLVSVNNPTCSILSTERRKQLVQVVEQLSDRLNRPLPLIVDTAYEPLIHDPGIARPDSAIRHDPKGLVYEIGTLSKMLAPTLRIGYMIGKDGPFMNAMEQKVSDVGFSAPLLCQQIAARILEQQAAGQLRQVNAGYREKAIATRAWIDQYLGDEVQSLVGGSAGFYFYLTFKHIRTDPASPFFQYLSGHVKASGQSPEALNAPGDTASPAPLETPRVIYIPGSFCVHDKGDLVDVGKRQLRLSYGYESLDQIQRAIRQMGHAIAYARKTQR